MGNGRTERDLDVDFNVGGVHARGVVDRVGIDPAAEKRELDAATLRDTEIGPFPDYFACTSFAATLAASLALSLTCRSVSPLPRT